MHRNCAIIENVQTFKKCVFVCQAIIVYFSNWLFLSCLDLSITNILMCDQSLCCQSYFFLLNIKCSLSTKKLRLISVKVKIFKYFRLLKTYILINKIIIWHQKWLPNQILDSQTVKNFKIDQQTTEIGSKKAKCDVVSKWVRKLHLSNYKEAELLIKRIL